MPALHSPYNRYVIPHALDYLAKHLPPPGATTYKNAFLPVAAAMKQIGYAESEVADWARSTARGTPEYTWHGLPQNSDNPIAVIVGIAKRYGYTPPSTRPTVIPRQECAGNCGNSILATHLDPNGLCPKCAGASLQNAVPFGLLADGKAVLPHQTPRGLACAAACPHCHAPLVARHGEIRNWHFAHYKATEPGLACAEESIHNLIRDTVAALADTHGYLALDGQDTRGVFARVQSAKTEVDLPEIHRRPDVLAEVQFYTYEYPDTPLPAKETCALEIAVTNPKDGQYARDMAEAGIPAYELKINKQSFFTLLTQQDPTLTAQQATYKIIQHMRWNPLWGPKTTRIGFFACGHASETPHFHPNPDMPRFATCRPAAPEAEICSACRFAAHKAAQEAEAERIRRRSIDLVMSSTRDLLAEASEWKRKRNYNASIQTLLPIVWLPEQTEQRHEAMAIIDYCLANANPPSIPPRFTRQALDLALTWNAKGEHAKSQRIIDAIHPDDPGHLEARRQYANANRSHQRLT